MMGGEPLILPPGNPQEWGALEEMGGTGEIWEGTGGSVEWEGLGGWGGSKG